MELPQLTTRTKVIVSVVVVVTSFAAGRYSVSQPAVKTQETTKTNETDNKNTDTKTHTETTETKQPDGEVVTKTITDSDTTTRSAETETQTTSETQTVSPQKVGTLNVSAMVGYNILSPTISPPIGISLTKQLIGPVTIGAFGFSNGLAGVSLGLSF